MINKKENSRGTEIEVYMKMFWNNIPGGIIAGYVRENYPLYFVNDSFLEIVGQTEAEFLESIHGNVFHRIFHEDRARITDEIQVQLQLYKRYAVEYSMEKKDGTQVWVYDTGYKRVLNGKDEIIISSVVDISQKIEEQEKLREDSLRDELTGLFNRKGGRIRVSKGLERRSPYIFLIMDIDHFKDLNDLYGHIEGDNVLRVLAGKLKESFREDDVVIRLGGDEFVIFLCPCKDYRRIEEKCRLMCREYVDFIREKYPLCKGSITLAGVWSKSFFPVSKLYEMTDQILYEMKRSRKGQCRIDIV